MKHLFLFALISTVCGFRFAKDLTQPTSKMGSAVDLAVATSNTQFHCMVKQNITAVIIRAFDGPNGVDPNACPNTHGAITVGLGYHIYMKPDFTKTAALQFSQTIRNMNSCLSQPYSFWLQVTTSVGWGNNVTANVEFIQEIIKQAQVVWKIDIGMYTSFSDWKTITNNWTGTNADVMLWYYNVKGNDVAGETTPDFSDYTKIGGFRHPYVKQYGWNENVCNMNVNVDAYEKF